MSQFRFVNACHSGDLERVKAVLDADVSVDQHCFMGYTALYVACHQGRLHVVRWLIEHMHADPNIPDCDGRTPFWCTCTHRGNLAIAKYLLAHGADPLTPNNDGVTPFWVACFAENMRTVQWLVFSVGIGNDMELAHVRWYSETVPQQSSRPGFMTWLAPFLRRRVLIAHWGIGRERRRSSRSGPGDTAEAAVWRRLPREALAAVLLMLAPPPV